MSQDTMNGAPPQDRPTSLGGLVEQISEQASRLVRAEIALAKAELADKAMKSGIGIGLFVAALVVVLYGIGVLLLAAVYGLGTVWPMWLAALAVGGFLVLVTLILALAGLALLRNGTRKPESMQRIKDDVTTIRTGIQEGLHR
ncbi:phage holin family protein [Myceligenerans indicum]|uniref:Phage holin family protein n=1 Tax=Myceligenerans indicum TaxID=2593663 RepID=A0ABS1LNP7_9MICO|nr:phage holin family protein [Myceligenerans indicum]MBL0887634.1 phage holin family protein [Myceligenerans indicum]